MQNTWKSPDGWGYNTDTKKITSPDGETFVWDKPDHPTEVDFNTFKKAWAAQIQNVPKYDPHPGKISGENFAKTVTAPYKYGGTDIHKGLDCSAFVLNTAKAQGIPLPRTAAAQFKTGKAVDKSSLSPGDLVYFDSPGKSGWHTGIYKGNGQFVHQSSDDKPGLSTSNLDEYSSRHNYKGARRVGIQWTFADELINPSNPEAKEISKPSPVKTKSILETLRPTTAEEGSLQWGMAQIDNRLKPISSEKRGIIKNLLSSYDGIIDTKLLDSVVARAKTGDYESFKTKEPIDFFQNMLVLDELVRLSRTRNQYNPKAEEELVENLRGELRSPVQGIPMQARAFSGGLEHALTGAKKSLGAGLMQLAPSALESLTEADRTKLAEALGGAVPVAAGAAATFGAGMPALSASLAVKAAVNEGFRRAVPLAASKILKFAGIDSFGQVVFDSIARTGAAYVVGPETLGELGAEVPASVAMVGAFGVLGKVLKPLIKPIGALIANKKAASAIKLLVERGLDEQQAASIVDYLATHPDAALAMPEVTFRGGRGPGVITKAETFADKLPGFTMRGEGAAERELGVSWRVPKTLESLTPEQLDEVLRLASQNTLPEDLTGKNLDLATALSTILKRGPELARFVPRTEPIAEEFALDQGQLNLARLKNWLGQDPSQIIEGERDRIGKVFSGRVDTVEKGGGIDIFPAIQGLTDDYTKLQNQLDRFEENLLTPPKIKDRSSFEKAVADAFGGLTPEQVDAVGTLMEARAKAWAEATGNPSHEYYYRIADVRKGLNALKEGLAQQAEPRDFSFTQNLKFWEWFGKGVKKYKQYPTIYMAAPHPDFPGQADRAAEGFHLVKDTGESIPGVDLFVTNVERPFNLSDPKNATHLKMIGRVVGEDLYANGISPTGSKIRKGVVDILEQQGYDSIQDGNVLIVFRPERVKNVENVGIWSKESADMLFQSGRLKGNIEDRLRRPSQSEDDMLHQGEDARFSIVDKSGNSVPTSTEWGFGHLVTTSTQGIHKVISGDPTWMGLKEQSGSLSIGTFEATAKNLFDPTGRDGPAIMGAAQARGEEAWTNWYIDHGRREFDSKFNDITDNLRSGTITETEAIAQRNAVATELDTAKKNIISKTKTEYLKSRDYDGVKTDDGILVFDSGSLSKAPKGVLKAQAEFLEDGRAIISAFEAADVSSIVHELGHVFRRDLSGELRKIAEDWAGVVDGKWTVEAEEKFARGFERYLADGEAPTEELKNVFQKFKDWLVSIYRTITGSSIDVDIKGIKSVYDSLLGGRGVLGKAKPTGAVDAEGPDVLFQAIDPMGINPAVVEEAIRQKDIPEQVMDVWKVMVLGTVHNISQNFFGNAFQKAGLILSKPARVATDVVLSAVTGKRTRTFTFKNQTQKLFTDISDKVSDTLADEIDKGRKWDYVEGRGVITPLTDAFFEFMDFQDRPWANFAFNASMEEQLKLANKRFKTNAKTWDELKGKNIDNFENVRQLAEIQAIADGEYATLKNRNRLAEVVNKGKTLLMEKGAAEREEVEKLYRELEDPHFSLDEDRRLKHDIATKELKTRRTEAVGRFAKTAGDVIFPFVTIPTNIGGRFVEWAGGGVIKGVLSGVKNRKALRAGKKDLQGAKVIAHELQREIVDNIGNGLTGVGFIYAGWLGYKNGIVTPYRNRQDYQEGAAKQETPGLIDVAGLQFDATSSHIGRLLAYGATLAKIAERAGDESFIGAMKAAGSDEGISTAISRGSETPIAGGTKLISDIFNSPDVKSALANEAQSRITGFIPGVLGEIRSLTSPESKVIEKPSINPFSVASWDSLSGRAMQKLPAIDTEEVDGWVKNPPRTDVLGQVIKRGFGERALEVRKTPVKNDVAEEMSKLGMSFSRPKKAEQNNDEYGTKKKPDPRFDRNEHDHQERIAYVGATVQSALSKIINSSKYKSWQEKEASATDEKTKKNYKDLMLDDLKTEKTAAIDEAIDQLDTWRSKKGREAATRLVWEFVATQQVRHPQRG